MDAGDTGEEYSGGIDWDSEGNEIRTDLFTVEVMSARGDTWIWNNIVLDDAMGVYESLGEPDTFYRLGAQRQKET